MIVAFLFFEFFLLVKQSGTPHVSVSSPHSWGLKVENAEDGFPEKFDTMTEQEIVIFINGKRILGKIGYVKGFARSFRDAIHKHYLKYEPKSEMEMSKIFQLLEPFAET